MGKPVRIGIMLRTFDEKGGIAVYSENIVAELLRIDRKNEYFLFYQSDAHLGRFDSYPNVTERVIRGRSSLIWDQVSIPYACWREGINVVFHPKFTAPVLAPAKAVMVVHGADWFFPDQAQYYSPADVWFTRRTMPIYFRKCAAVISVSKLTTENFNAALQLPEGKVRTVYFGPARHFRRIHDACELAQVRRKYELPERFVLTLTKPLGDGRKNLAQILNAYEKYHRDAEAPPKLVIGGQDAHLYREKYGLNDRAFGADVHFPGWIDQADMPAVFSLAEVFLYPSRLEAFPIPVTEAMACGTPVITSDVNGLEEIAGDSALLVDPDDAHAIVEALARVTADATLRDELSRKGLLRAKQFTWDECAHRTLAILEQVGGAGA